jgi:GNAT superfamily N-acetyltransferase
MSATTAAAMAVEQLARLGPRFTGTRRCYSDKPGAILRPVKGLRPEEEWARAVVSQALSVPVEQHDDNSRDGMHDLWIVYPDGPLGAMEVTLAADSESIELYGLMDGGRRQIFAGLAGGWRVVLDPSARAKRLSTELQPFLAELEAAGQRSVDVEPGGVSVGIWQQRARDLRIANLFQGGTDYPGSVYIDVEPRESAGLVARTGDAIAAWIGDYLRGERRDVLAKLARSGVQERHAFVLVPGFTPAPFAVTELLMNEHARLPLVPPQLPAEVTHVWVVGSFYGVEGFYWAPDIGWSPVRTPSRA